MKNILLINLFADMLFHIGIAMFCSPAAVMLYLQEYCHATPYEISLHFNDFTPYGIMGFILAIVGIIIKQRKILTLKIQKNE